MMLYVPDTNVWLRSEQKNHPVYPLASGAIATILRRNEKISLLPQAVYELWNVCTRPEKYNGFGRSLDETEQIVARLESAFPVLYDTKAVYQEWRHLVRLHNVSGVQVHDARIAAAVRVHHVDFLLTFNGDDFKRFGIATIHPNDVLALP
jgi:predicted nucleic acid-binding protein